MLFFSFKKKLRKKKLCHICLPCNLKRTMYDKTYEIHFKQTVRISNDLMYGCPL